MNLLDELRELGVSVDEGVKRLGGSAAIYKKMLGSFKKMMNTYSFEPDFGNEGYEDIIEKAHAIIGASGNLSVTPVYEAYSQIVDLLRAGQPDQAREALLKVLPVQEKIISTIDKYAENK